MTRLQRTALWFVMIAYVIGEFLRDALTALEHAVHHLEGEQ